MKVVLLVLVLCALAPGAEGHARLLEPPGRSSAWRFGFSNPKNVNDNELNCGGAGNQWASQGGKCGLCGDPYQTARPRANEDGGKYGNGIITKTYNQGQWIDITIAVTANHMGWFETRVCSLDVGGESEACFDQHLLEVDTGGTRWKLPGGIREFTYKVKLPDNLSCMHCSVQWKWHCANNWGIDPVTGRGCTGCAPEQESFWGCSDVAITPSGGQPVQRTTTAPATMPPKPMTSIPTEPTTTTPKPWTHAPKPTTTTPKPWTHAPKPMTNTPKPWTNTPEPVVTSTARPSMVPTTTSAPAVSRTNAPITQKPTQPSLGSFDKCRSAGVWSRQANSASMDSWCRQNCFRGYCPASHCRCD